MMRDTDAGATHCGTRTNRDNMQGDPQIRTAALTARALVVSAVQELIGKKV